MNDNHRPPPDSLESIGYNFNYLAGCGACAPRCESFPEACRASWASACASATAAWRALAGRTLLQRCVSTWTPFGPQVYCYKVMDCRVQNSRTLDFSQSSKNISQAHSLLTNIVHEGKRNNTHWIVSPMLCSGMRDKTSFLEKNKEQSPHAHLSNICVSAHDWIDSITLVTLGKK